MRQLDWDGGMIWVSVPHWLLQSRTGWKCQSLWKCCDNMWLFLLKCHHLWYFYCGWTNSLLDVNGFMCGELCKLDWDGGMIWVSVSHWFLQSRKAEMPCVWKCHDGWHFYWNVTTRDIFFVVEWIACWSEWMHVWMDVSAGLRWRNNLSIVFALPIAKQEGWNAFCVKMLRLVTFLLKCHHLEIFLLWLNE